MRSAPRPDQLQATRDAANRADFNEMISRIHVNTPHRRRRSWQRTVDAWTWAIMFIILFVLLIVALSGMM